MSKNILHNKSIGKPIVKKNYKENININGHVYSIYTDNRTKSSRIDVHHYKIGDLHRPWYFYGDINDKEMRNNNINNVSLIYDIKDEIIDLSKKNVNFTSYYYDETSPNMDYLVDTFKNEEQKELVICEKHYSKNANNLFFKNCELDDLRVFEGHHRLTALKRTKKILYARIYYSYNLNIPISIEKHYNSSYCEDLWNIYKKIFDEETMKPWFKLEQFNNLKSLAKYDILQKCINFILSLNINIKNGLDIGCAEGAYTYLFSKKLNILNMTGLDSEPSRIIRAFLSKYYYNLKNIDFRVEKIENFNYDKYDFISCLSVTHHLNNPMKIMEKICKNKKIVILENRIKNNTQEQKNNINNVISIKTFIDFNFTEELSKKLNMSFKLIGNMSDRYFYVLYKK